MYMITTSENGFKISHVDHIKPWKWITPLKFLALAMPALALPIQAAVYYVDRGQGSDSNNGTSTNSAWAHPPGTVGVKGSGWVTIRNGDTILVKGGTTNSVQVVFDSSYYS